MTGIGGTLVRPASAPVLTGGLVVWEGLFTAAELDALERHGDGLHAAKAGLADGPDDYDGIRVTQVAWFERDRRTEDFYRRMEDVILRINERFFRYDLLGLVPFQYAIYRQDEGGHFDWHQDYGRGPGGEEPRKLTFSIQISDGASYEGCELQVRAGNAIGVAPRKRGTLVAFPAYALHRVTPITKGVRKSLVMWAAGPDFR